MIKDFRNVLFSPKGMGEETGWKDIPSWKSIASMGRPRSNSAPDLSELEVSPPQAAMEGAGQAPPRPRGEVVADRLHLWWGDITTYRGGAILNPSNANMTGEGAGGLSGAIHRKAGEALEAECRESAGQRVPLNVAETVVTNGHGLPCDKIVHVVSPGRCMAETLEECYRNSLGAATEAGCRDVCFSLLGAGSHFIPADRVARAAIETASKWLREHPDGIERIVFCCFEEDQLVEFKQELGAHTGLKMQKI